MPEIVSECTSCNWRKYKKDQRATYYLNLPEPFNVVICTNCKLRWLNPRPTDDEYQKIYTEAYFLGREGTSSDSDWLESFALRSGDYEMRVIPERLKWYKARLKRLRELLPEGKSMFDIGAGTGDFLALARNDGWNVSGIELSAYACNRALVKHGISLECTDLVRFDPQGKTFDVIHLSHVFEHFTRPNKALYQLGNLMHQGSLLVIEVPNQFGFLIQILRKLKGPKQIPKYIGSIHHPYFWNRKQLVYLLKRGGFRVIGVRTYFPERRQANWQLRLLGVIEFFSDLVGGCGENIEIITQTE